MTPPKKATNAADLVPVIRITYFDGSSIEVLGSSFTVEGGMFSIAPGFFAPLVNIKHWEATVKEPALAEPNRAAANGSEA